jgi:hypothetical protein
MKTAQDFATRVKKTGVFKDALYEIVNIFPERTQKILKDRYNLDGMYTRGKTLDAIGKQYNITRERVRQIIQFSIKTARDEGIKNIEDAIEVIDAYLLERGGVYAKDALVSDIELTHPQELGALDFLLDTAQAFKFYSRDKQMTHTIARRDFDIQKLRTILFGVEGVLRELQCPTDIQFLQQEWQKRAQKDVDTRHFESFLVSSANIEKNILDQWGLISWGEICPRSSGQRAFLVLQKFKRPMHFSEIAQKINELNLSSRKANPQTVHNELIKSTRFVLLGRGVYGLAEWQ